jgi:hypothetical protein
VPQQIHVIDRIGTGHHAGNQRGHLRPGRATRPTRHRQMPTRQLTQTSALRQCQHRHQPDARHQTRIIEARRPDRIDMR